MKFPTVLLLFSALFACKPESKSSSGPVVLNEIETPVNVEIFAEQFKWSARYSGEDNELGKFDYKLMSASNPLGIVTERAIESRIRELERGLNRMDSMSLNMEISHEFEKKRKEKILRLLELMGNKHDRAMDKVAMNDFIVTDTLVLCVDTEYDFSFRSKDVIHAAYFPHFRAQMNIVPGMTTRFKLTPSETTEERRLKLNDVSFEFQLICNKVCGAGHTLMKMIVRVVEKQEYLDWLKSNRNDTIENLLSIQVKE
ncbi:MAG: hypothetical protein AB8B56_18325 [Crocinitomicaceae bacterium]